MYDFEITCIKRDRLGRVAEIGVVDHDSGLKLNCSIDIEKAIQGERGGLWRFYTTGVVNGVPVRTRVKIIRGKTTPYLRTLNDKLPNNNLKFFKECENCDPCLDL
jgi:hypothetical protein